MIKKTKTAEERESVLLWIPSRMLSKIDGIAKEGHRSRTSQLLLMLENELNHKSEALEKPKRKKAKHAPIDYGDRDVRDRPDFDRIQRSTENDSSCQ